MQTQQVILDVLKPTGTIVDLSDSFNARVGDKMTPFQLFILEGGIAKDLKGMHPELEAVVGNGALKGNKAIMAAGAKGVHWVGSTNCVTGYNQLTLAFPAEVFPQSGFCYGHLILANDAGVRESSVDIWFQVLDGTPQMGMVADHYDSELALELAKAKNENEQFSQEMRDTYNQQVTDAQNALTKATSNLSSLAATAGNVEAQITAQDIVKRSEFGDLSNKVTQRLLNFDDKPAYYTNASEIKASNPNGSNRICVALDTKHRWIYTNGNWQDCGIAKDNAFEASRDASQDVMFGQNVADWHKSDKGTIIPATEDFATFENKTIMHLQSTNTDDYVYIASDVVPVSGHIISVQFPEMIRNLSRPNTVSCEIRQLTPTDNPNDSSTFANNSIWLHFNDPQMTLYKATNLKLNNDTDRLQVVYQIHDDIGDAYVGKPVINYGTQCIPYSPLQHIQDAQATEKKLTRGILNTSQNLLFSQTIEDWTPHVNGVAVISNDPLVQFANTPIMHIEEKKAGSTNSFVSEEIQVDNTIISVQLPEMIVGEDYPNSHVYLTVYPLAKDESVGVESVNAKAISFPLGNATMKLGKFENIKLPTDTERIAIGISQNGIGHLFFGIPTVNYGPTCIAYNTVLLGKSLDLSSAIIPQLYINASSGATGYDKTPVSFKLVRNFGIDYGYLVFDIQGDSSRGYRKKNFKIKLFSDPDGKSKLKLRILSSWQNTNKFNLKANWIDATQSRNIVSARLIKDALTTVGLEKPSQTSSLLQTEGLGQIDGMPVELYFNYGYYGLCTLNTKKDDLTFGMDSKNTEQEVLSTEVGAADFMNSAKTIDGKDWSTEIHDTATDDIKANLKAFQDFVTNSSDADFKAKIHDYIDVKSVMIEVLYGWLSHEWDYYSKSELLATWNAGKYWYLIPYDMDSTWGLLWNGSKVDIDDDWFSFANANSSNTAIINSQNKLHERIVKVFNQELKTLAQQLRMTVWSNQAIIERFKQFIDEVPVEIYRKNAERWSDIPSLKTTSFRQLQSAIIQRGQEFDNFISKIQCKILSVINVFKNRRSNT